VAIDVVGDFMKLASAQKELRELSKNLAFNLEKLQGPERLGSKFTVKTDKAECDLDSAVTEGVKDQNGVRHQLTEEQIVSLGDDILNAYVALHRLGFVHGDSKLENILLLIDKDGNNYAQLIDLGKLEVVSANQAVLNKGNQRTCPPEGKVSHRGETYSVGMMLIQMFEQSILRDKMAKNPNDNMLISTPNVDSSKKVAKNRNGLEKFAVQNKNMSQSESFLGRVSTIGDILLNAITGKVSNQDAEKEIYTYVYALVNEKNKIVMNDNSKTPQEKADLLKRNNDFGALLRSMLTSDRNARITMNEAQNRYRRIFGIQREV
jgi:serine/threonine protein kinase